MPSNKKGFKIFYALSIAWQLGFIIAVPIGGFMLLGLWGDNVLGTRPFLLVVSLFIGFIITAYEIYHMFYPLIKEDEKDA